MGDAGEGLIDADARIQERMEELERDRQQQTSRTVKNPEAQQALESLRLARTELQRQLEATTVERRRTQIRQAIQEVERRMAEAQAKV
jgi:chromosome segregation ATPase